MEKYLIFYLKILFQVTVWDYDRFGANEFLGSR